MIRLGTVALFAVITAAAGPLEAKTVQFSGYSWTVRDGGYGSPGDNAWSADNVFVDASGALHVKLTYVGGVWRAAELYTDQPLGFGTYQFEIANDVSGLDPNVVLGLFSYPTPDVGPDRTNEIDIEIARWANPANKNLNYTVWPVLQQVGQSAATFTLAPYGRLSATHSFTWTSTAIHFSSWVGHGQPGSHRIADVTYAPQDYAARISQSPMPLHINLWSHPVPSDGRPVEVIIRRFTFQPQ